MHAGVMKHVGEAVRDHMVAHGHKNKIIAIGIGTFGCVNNKEALIEKKVILAMNFLEQIPRWPVLSMYTSSKLYYAETSYPSWLSRGLGQLNIGQKNLRSDDRVLLTLTILTSSLWMMGHNTNLV